MFQVRRYTGDKSQHDGPPASTRGDLLNKLVERAKSRAKQARPESKDSSISPPSSGAVGSPASATVQYVGSKTPGLQRKVDGPNIHHTDDTVHRSDPDQENPRALLKKRPRVEPQGRSKFGDDTTQTAKEKKIREERELGESSLKDTRPLDDDDDAVEREERAGLRPMEEVAAEWGLHARLAQSLREEGIKHFFPVQVRVVPDILATERHSHVQSRDICVSAPTGSGKTLVFVLGVLQALIRRRVVRLRALVLLPSRDLALQVHSVFKRYAQGTGLRVGLAIGQTNFLEEQLSLVGAVALAGNPVGTAREILMRKQGKYTVSDPERDYGVDVGGMSSAGAGAGDGDGDGDVPAGGASEVDVVVATPGRLLDHLERTPGFSLQHLRYLVLDEADRLLGRSYQGWVGKVLKAAYRRDPGFAEPVFEGTGTEAGEALAEKPRGTGLTGDADRIEGSQYTGVDWPKDGAVSPRKSCERLWKVPSAVRLEPVTVRGRPLATGDRVRGATVATPPLRKLLFSATLTSNPQKLAGLDVMNPLVYSAREIRPVSTKPAARGRREDREGAAEEEADAVRERAAGGEDVGGGGDRGLEGGAEEDEEVKRPRQKTWRADLDGVELAEGSAGRDGRFSTPATLEEIYTVCDSQAKPLVLLSMLKEAAGRRRQLTAVFTSSVDSTHRLYRLLQLFGGFLESRGGDGDRAAGVEDDSDAAADAADEDDDDDDDDRADVDGEVVEFSRNLSQSQRSRIIRRARAGAIRVIVCSDGMARGMDLEGIGLVINYDVPMHAKTYVHRVGRTARAGSKGTAVTIIKKGQEKQFLRMRAGVDGKKVCSDSSPAEQSRLQPLVQRYRRCLEDLKEVLEAEKAGELDPSAPVTAMEE